MREQHPAACGIPILGCKIQGRLAIIILGIDIGSVFQQDLATISGPLARRNVQGSHSDKIPCIRVGAMLQKQPAAFRMALACRGVQRGIGIKTTGGIDIRTGAEKQAHQACVSHPTSCHQRYDSIFIRRIDIRDAVLFREDSDGDTPLLKCGRFG